MKQHSEQDHIERMVHQEIYLNMSLFVSELMSKDPEFIDEFPELIDGYVENEDGEEEYLEIFEYWAVSDWLANKLILRGERIEKDFFGHSIWGRTTCGQSISMDEVIKRIAHS